MTKSPASEARKPIVIEAITAPWTSAIDCNVAASRPCSTRSTGVGVSGVTAIEAEMNATGRPTTRIHSTGMRRSCRPAAASAAVIRVVADRDE